MLVGTEIEVDRYLRPRGQLRDGVLKIELRGMLTRSGIYGLRDAVRETAEARNVRVVVIDMRGAAVMLSGDDWLAYAQGPGLPMPVGLVVDETQRRAALQFCLRMAFSGYERAAFACPERAQQWADSSFGR